ncbi:polyprenol monophosphomannose synthase [Streptomyces sp. GD-15H]|uniref:polyprenol monophosphomannose synthase n=1 Tax=Streptomyces sp. GD-15H TaxID=3129112 RepID=UPI003251F56C
MTTDNSEREDVLVVMPTYNEHESLPDVLGRLRRAVPRAHVLVVDDASPDGTGRLAEELATRDTAVHVLHREAKEGLGRAYTAGFAWGLERGYGVLVEMDADGSHQPEELPRLLTALDRADLVIGSRWVSGGRVVDWPLSRRLLSRWGNAYTRLMLSIGVRDATAGFRAYRADVLRGIPLAEVESHGYCFQVDLTLRTALLGLRITEVPVTFVERALGQSKMSGAIVREALVRITRWGWERRRTPRPAGASERAGTAGAATRP